MTQQKDNEKQARKIHMYLLLCFDGNMARQRRDGKTRSELKKNV